MICNYKYFFKILDLLKWVVGYYFLMLEINVSDESLLRNLFGIIVDLVFFFYGVCGEVGGFYSFLGLCLVFSYIWLFKLSNFDIR